MRDQNCATASDIDRAEQFGQARAILFYLLAAALVLSTIVGLGDDAEGSRIAVWLVMMLLVALNLSSLPTSMRRGRWARLINDETTRNHRRECFAAGFWVAIVVGLVLAAAGSWFALDVSETARLIVSAGMAAALLRFAWLERRAAVNG